MTKAGSPYRARWALVLSTMLCSIAKISNFSAFAAAARGFGRLAHRAIDRMRCG